MKPYCIREHQGNICEKSDPENQLLELFYETYACWNDAHVECKWGREGSLLGSLDCYILEWVEEAPKQLDPVQQMIAIVLRTYINNLAISFEDLMAAIKSST